MSELTQEISVRGACEHNLKDVDINIERGTLTVVTGMSGSGKSSLAFDTILAEAQRRFFYTLSHYSRQFLDLGSRPAVKHISGLSPAIALAQNETLPSKRATVGTLTDVAELLGVMFARFGEQHCPKHGLPTQSLTLKEIAQQLHETHAGQTLAICAPIAANKKGNFSTRLQKIASRGFLRAYIDGHMVSLNPVPQLAREEKHTIKVVIDVIKIGAKAHKRLLRSMETALDEGQGFGEYFMSDKLGNLAIDTGHGFSMDAGCPTCGFSWPHLDSRYFSSNSLGRCVTCDGLGEQTDTPGEDDLYEEDDDRLGIASRRCRSCHGSGLDPQYGAIKLFGRSVGELHASDISDVHELLRSVSDPVLTQNPAFKRVCDQLCTGLARIEEVGLGYLQMQRRVRSLSGGELQRLKLAGILGESLRGILYVLDEPSQGLHPSEIMTLCASLKQLRDQGNTVIAVDHDETLMQQADWIIDLGPGGGARGGQLMAKFAPTDAAHYGAQSVTARHLGTKKQVKTTKAADKTDGDFITVRDAHLHNLQLGAVRFLKERLNVVTGVSGAGKSSLVLSTLHENVYDYLDSWTEDADPASFAFRFCASIEGIDDLSVVELIDRRPVAKSSVSMPATYLDIFTELRKLYGKLPEAQINGLDAAAFSLAREGGRCEECRGRGEISLSMRFLADARVPCHICNGSRYRPHVLGVRYNGLNLADVLKLTIDEAAEHFKTFRLISKRLKPAIDLGLGYLKLGQPSASLSGGEAQRLKLAPFLTKQHDAGSLIILDEPTTGLHFEDVQRLMECLEQLVAKQATVVLVEHNIDVAKAADWVIDLGPGAASQGGRLLYEGPPQGLLKTSSPTAEYLRH